MFNRRKLLIALCILACALLAGGFVGVNLLGWWSIPLLGSLYANGWWTLLLILPSLTMFALDGYSRPALALLSAGLLLFANTHGMIMGDVLDAAVPALFATVAGGAAVEITAKIANRQKKAPRLENKKKKELEDKSKVFAPENVSSSQPKAADAPVQPPKSPASPPPQTPPSPQPQPSQSWNRPFKQSETAAKQTENQYSRSAQTGGTAREPSPWAKPQKGWDPSKTYRNPKDRRISQGANVPQSPNAPQTAQPHTSVTTQRQSGTANVWKREGKLTTVGSFPEVIAFFDSRKASSSHQNLIGGRAISIFGDAKLTLRDADYSRPIEISLVSLFGSAKVEVPYVSNIRVNHLNLFGDCKDKRRLVNSSAMPLITVQCISLFGDCQIM